MKWLSLFIALFCLVVCQNVQAQIDVRTDPRIAPLLRQAANGQQDLVIFGRKPASNMYVNMAVLDKTHKRLYWFTCYGTAYDSVQLQEIAFVQISSNAIDPFSFYRELCLENEMYLDDAVAEYRRLGKLALKDTSYNRRIVYNSSTVKAANSTLQQLMALEGLFKKQCIKLCLFNCPSPSSLSRDEGFLFRKSLAGKTMSRPDTTIYYPTSPLGFIAKISLCRLDSLKMFVYDGQDKVVDSMPLRPGKYTSLLRSKDDVFLLYRGWLELQSQQIKEAISQTTALLNRQDTGLYIQTYRSDNRKELLSAVAQFKIEQQNIERRILALTLPDEEMIGHMLQSNYSSEGTQITYLAAGMGFAYTASNSRGEKEYELTNHLGNVIATVSDRKLGIDGGNGTVAYYNVDVVNSNDYYPFGSWMPGRLYSKSEKYRYGFNGKENDDEVKGGGEQQDYGMRVYDPRVGRFLSIDPLFPKYPELTPYQFASNSPISGIDEDGLEWAYFDKNNKQVDINSSTTKEDKLKIVGVRWAGYDVDDKGNKTAKSGTVSTAFTFGKKGITVSYLNSKGDPARGWVAYSKINTIAEGTDSKIGTLHSLVQDDMKSFILMSEIRFGIDLRVTDGFRTVEQQDELYAKGRTTSGKIVTKAKGGYSNHNFGLAVDVVPFENGKLNWDTKYYPLIGLIGESRGLEWGHRWKAIDDKPHFQNLQGLSLGQLRVLPKDENGLPIIQ